MFDNKIWTFGPESVLLERQGAVEDASDGQQLSAVFDKIGKYASYPEWCTSSNADPRIGCIASGG